SQLNCIEQSNLRFSGFSLSAILRQFIPFLYISFCFLWNVHISLIQLVAIYILAIVVATFVSFLFTYRFITFSKLIDFGWIKKILNFGKYSFGIWLNTMLSSSIDQMMLGSMLSKSASGSFNVAVRVTNLTDIPANSIASIVFPQSSKRFEEEGDSSIKYMYEKSVGVILAILIPMLIIIYLSLDYILLFVAGEKYQGVLPLLQIVLAGTIVSPFGRQTGIVLAASGRAKVNFYLMLASTILVVLFNLLLIKPYGVFGAAIASIAAGLVLFIISQFLLKKYYKVSIKNVFIYAISFYKEFYHNYILKRK
ncbi:MAG: oligosaccharide flippase family protein, partial [Niabella sp.]